MSRALAPLLLVLALLATLLGACPPREERPAAAVRPFVWTSPEPRSVDPTYIGDAPGAFVALNLFEGLYVVGPDDAPPRLGQAESHEVSPDGREHRFILRQDARWSDGRPLRAEDFVFAWRRMLAPESAAPGAEDLWRIEGGRAFHEGRGEALGLRAEGERRLVVRLERPDPLFAEALASSRFLPLPAHLVEARGAAWWRPEHIVTNGPYVLSDWAPGQRLVLRRSSTYPERAGVAIERAELRVVEREELAMRLYEAGEVDYTPGQVPFEALVRWQSQGRPDLRFEPLPGVAYLAFHLGRAPFDDRRVRQAFDRAIDKRGLVDAVLRGAQVPATGIVSPTYAALVGYEGQEGPGYDPEAARALLAEAGYPGGAGFPEVEIACNTSEVLARLLRHVAADLQRNLGLRVTVRQSEWKSFLATVRAGDFQIARFALQGGADPLELLSVFRSGAPNNIGAYAEPAFDALLDAALASGERRERFARAAAAEQRLVADAAVLPLYFPTRASLLNPRIEGFQTQSLGLHLLRYLRVLT